MQIEQNVTNPTNLTVPILRAYRANFSMNEVMLAVKTGIIGIITILICSLCNSALANEALDTDTIKPELELKIHKPYSSEPYGKKYCDVWVTAKQLAPKHGLEPDVEIIEFKSPVADESKIRQEFFNAISLHKVTSNFYILAKVKNNVIVEYRYTYFKKCKWVSDGPTKPNKSPNKDTADAGAG